MSLDLEDLNRQIERSIPQRDGVLTIEQARALVVEVVLLRTGLDATRAYADRVEREMLLLRGEVERLQVEVQQEREAAMNLFQDLGRLLMAKAVEHDEMLSVLRRGKK